MCADVFLNFWRRLLGKFIRKLAVYTSLLSYLKRMSLSKMVWRGSLRICHPYIRPMARIPSQKGGYSIKLLWNNDTAMIFNSSEISSTVSKHWRIWRRDEYNSTDLKSPWSGNAHSWTRLEANSIFVSLSTDWSSIASLSKKIPYYYQCQDFSYGF